MSPADRHRVRRHRHRHGRPGLLVHPTYREFAPLPAALLARGFSEADTRRVLGGNFLRLFETVMDA